MAVSTDSVQRKTASELKAISDRKAQGSDFARRRADYWIGEILAQAEIAAYLGDCVASVALHGYGFQFEDKDTCVARMVWQEIESLGYTLECHKDHLLVRFSNPTR